jgi:hypothetical protein
MTDHIALNGPEIERIAAGGSSDLADINTAIQQRAEIAEKAGLPATAIKFLTGDDEETLASQAGSLAGLLAGSSPRPRMVVPGEGSHPAIHRSNSALEDQLRKALSLPPAW